MRTKEARTLASSNSSKSKFVRSILSRWQLYLLCLPAVIYIIMFAYKPMAGVLIAFKDFKMKLGIWDSPWADPWFKQFDRLFDSYWFPIILKNTVVLSALTLFLSFPLSIVLALLVNEIRRGYARKTFQIVSYAPHFISTVVVCSMVILFTSPTSGIINMAVKWLGGDAYDYMADPKMFKWVYVISAIWQGAGWNTIVYTATLSSVDKNLHEAAEIDGASRLQRIIHINLPVLIPTIVIMLILRCGQIMSVGYEKVYLLQNATTIASSEVISTYVYKIGIQNSQYAFSTAVGVFNSVVNCIFLVTVNKISDKLTGSGLF